MAEVSSETSMPERASPPEAIFNPLLTMRPPSDGRKAKGDPSDGLEFYFSLALQPFILVIHFVKHHLELTISGETPRLEIEFSALVAVSSLLYAPVAMAFWYNKSYVMAICMALITITSLVSDSIDPSSRFWSRADRVICTVAGFFGPLRALVVAASPLHKLEVVLVCLGALCFLGWSRQSTNQHQFSIRHTCWHIASAAGLTWLAFAVPWNY